MKFLPFVVLLLAAAPACAETYHVSPALLATVPAARQFRAIGDAAKIVKAGDTVVLHSGVYREAVTVTASGTRTQPIRFVAAPSANVTVTGADRLSGFVRERANPDEQIYSVAWPYTFIGGPMQSHPDDDYHRLIGRAEQVFASGYALHQVLRRDQMSRGTFFVDTDAKRLYLWRADNQPITAKDSTVEASIRSVLWQSTGANVQLRGVRFRYAANRAQQGAAQFSGPGDVVEDCVFERTNGSGATFAAPYVTVRRCTFSENGQLGFGANGAHRLHLTGCLVRANNVKGFSRGWEAGGAKIVLTRTAVIEQCRFEENRGNGLWFDIGNEQCEVRNCLIAGNEDAGIFYEISYGLYAHDNVVIGNGLADTPGGWGASAGICLSSSPGCRIERNLLVGNKEGFNFREQNRTTWRIGFKEGQKELVIWNHDEQIRNNVLAANRDAQTWGWFDIWDERHWPRAQQVNHGREKPSRMPDADFAQGYQALESAGALGNLDLERLHLTFANNLYDVPDGQELFHWGTAWLRHRYFGDLATVRGTLGMEQGSRVAPFRYADYPTRDFRVPSGSPVVAMHCYPHGTVPDVRLGILPMATAP